MENGKTILSGLLLFLMIMIGLATLHAKSKNHLRIDLTEEISQANDNDTLIAIKKGNTLHIQFNN